MRERGYEKGSSKLLARTAGEGGPSPKGLVGEGLCAQCLGQGGGTIADGAARGGDQAAVADEAVI